MIFDGVGSIIFNKSSMDSEKYKWLKFPGMTDGILVSATAGETLGVGL